MRKLTPQERLLMYAAGLAFPGLLFIFGGWVVMGFTLSMWALFFVLIAHVPKLRRAWSA
jgi:hypothetical protein